MEREPARRHRRRRAGGRSARLGSERRSHGEPEDGRDAGDEGDGHAGEESAGVPGPGSARVGPRGDRGRRSRSGRRKSPLGANGGFPLRLEGPPGSDGRLLEPRSREGRTRQGRIRGDAARHRGRPSGFGGRCRRPEDDEVAGSLLQLPRCGLESVRENADDLGVALRAVLAVLGHHPLHERGDGRRDERQALRGGHFFRHVPHVQVDVAQRRIGVERKDSGQDPVEDDAERVDVASPVDRLPGAEQPDELGRPVLWLPHQDAGLGEVVQSLLLLGVLRDPEVEDLRERAAVLLRNEDVVGGEVPVDDRLRGEVLHPVADLDQDGDQLRPGPSQVGRQRHPVEELHREVRLPFVEPHFQERDDVRVAELFEDLRFADESPHGVVVLRLADPGNDLQRHDPAGRSRILGGIDDAHSPLSELADRAIRTYLERKGGRRRAAHGAPGLAATAPGGMRRTRMPGERMAGRGRALPTLARQDARLSRAAESCVSVFRPSRT